MWQDTETRVELCFHGIGSPFSWCKIANALTERKVSCERVTGNTRRLVPPMTEARRLSLAAARQSARWDAVPRDWQNWSPETGLDWAIVELGGLETPCTVRCDLCSEKWLRGSLGAYPGATWLAQNRESSPRTSSRNRTSVCATGERSVF